MRRTDVVFAIARKELTDRFRNRWILVVSSILVVSALIISYFGAVPVGLTGFQKTGMTLVSLMNLAMYLVPLLALALGSFVIIDEKSNGTLDLILSLPLSTGEYLAGTFLGLTLALGASIALGFGAAGVILLAQGGIVSFFQYLTFLLLTLLLGVVFLALSYVISIMARDKGKALAVSLFAWIGAVFLFDVVLIGVVVASGGAVGTDVFGFLLLLNPVDVFRMLVFSLVENAAAPIGLSSVDIPAALSPAVLLAVLAAWVVVLLFLVRRTFQRRIGFDLWTEMKGKHK